MYLSKVLQITISTIIVDHHLVENYQSLMNHLMNLTLANQLQTDEFTESHQIAIV